MSTNSIIKKIISTNALLFQKYSVKLSCGHMFVFDEGVTPNSKQFFNLSSMPCKKCFFKKKEL